MLRMSFQRQGHSKEHRKGGGEGPESVFHERSTQGKVIARVSFQSRHDPPGSEDEPFAEKDSLAEQKAVVAAVER